MLTLVFVLFWVFLGLGLVIVALSGGPRGAARSMHGQSRRGRRAAIGAFVVAFVVLGVGVPAAVIAAEDDRNDIPEADVSNLTAAEKHGQELFGRRCVLCHTLKAANAVAQVGPDLDALRPSKALVLDAIKNGRSQGNGQMAAGIYSGQDAQDVAAFVAKAVGSTNSGG
jgi:mono/diheme cytochrome c family protein